MIRIFANTEGSCTILTLIVDFIIVIGYFGNVLTKSIGYLISDDNRNQGEQEVKMLPNFALGF